MRVYLFLVLRAFCAVIYPFSGLLYLTLEFCKFWNDGENCKNRTATARGLYIFLTKKKYPDGCTNLRTRVIRNKALKFKVKDG